jgi:hypothetical protein
MYSSDYLALAAKRDHVFVADNVERIRAGHDTPAIALLSGSGMAEQKMLSGS